MARHAPESKHGPWGHFAVARGGQTRHNSPELMRRVSMIARRLLRSVGPIAMTGLALSGCDGGPSKAFVRPKPVMVFQPREMTDSLYALIAAHREVYASNIVERLGIDGTSVRASTAGDAEKTALPAHLLRSISPNVASRGVEFHFVGRSLWPIDPRSAPATDTERQGLESVAQNPGKNFYAEEALGGRRYFTAVYPDRAVGPTCASCHNAHPQSPRQDFKTGDVMGGIVVRVPLEL
jgi:hypothetical protein